MTTFSAGPALVEIETARPIVRMTGKDRLELLGGFFPTMLLECSESSCKAAAKGYLRHAGLVFQGYNFNDRGCVFLAREEKRAQWPEQEIIEIRNHGFGRQHARSELFVELFEANGGIGDVADNLEAQMAAAADMSEEYGTRVQANANLKT